MGKVVELATQREEFTLDLHQMQSNKVQILHDIDARQHSELEQVLRFSGKGIGRFDLQNDMASWSRPDRLSSIRLPGRDQMLHDTSIDSMAETLSYYLDQVALCMQRFFPLPSIGANSGEAERVLAEATGKLFQNPDLELDSLNNLKKSRRYKAIAKKLKDDDSNREHQLVLGQMYCESGVLDEVLVRARMHWRATVALNESRAIEALKCLFAANRYEALLRNCATNGRAISLLSELVNSHGDAHLLGIAIACKDCLPIFDKHSRELGGWEALRKLLKQGKGIEVLHNIVTSKDAGSFLLGILDGGGAQKLALEVFKNVRAQEVLAMSLKSQLQSDLGLVRQCTEVFTSLFERVLLAHETAWICRSNSLKYLAKILDSIDAGRASVDIDDLKLLCRLDNNSLCSLKRSIAVLEQTGQDRLLNKFFSSSWPRFLAQENAVYSLALFLNRNGLERLAKPLVLKLIRRDKKNAKLWYLLAKVEVGLGKYRRAIKACKKVIKYEDQQGEAFNLIGVIYRRCGKHKKAVYWYEQGLDRDPACTKIYHNLSIAYAHLGRIKESRECKERALRSAAGVNASLRVA